MSDARRAVALVGCGNMGSAIAARLASRVRLCAYDVEGSRADALAAELGVGVAAAVADAVRDAAALVLSLPHAAASRAAVSEALRVLRPGAVVIETSTVKPADVRELARSCASAGVLVVDAAILAGVDQMRAGAATLLLGGEADAQTAAAPVLDALSSRQLRLGELGAGMAAKVANNAVSHAVMVVLLEAAALARSQGVDAATFARLLADPDAGLLRPLTHRLGERVLRGDYGGGMPTEAARKDSMLALELAQESGVPLLAIQSAHTVYELAVASGWGRDDYAGIARLWEAWTGRSFVAPEETE